MLLFLGSCVSVKIGDKVSKKSERYEYGNPGGSFYRIKDQSADVAFLSDKTGSTLSIKSKCSKNNEVDLDNWLNQLTENLKNSRVLFEEKLKINNRRAIKAVVQSTIEGFDNRIAVTTFVKNSCQYIIVLTSLPNSFENDQIVYEKFLKGFRAW